jgi:2-octaprenyl-6-methoxyphenol hydroxylase
MNICILGDSLTGLSLARNLVNKKLNVHVFFRIKKNLSNQSSRTIGLSRNSIDFINKEIIKIKPKLLWDINKIEVFSKKSENQSDKILNFENKRNLFAIIKNKDLYKLLDLSLSKNKYFHKKKLIEKKLNQKFMDKYDLVINCDTSNKFSKKFFFNSIKKNYNNTAYTTIIKHKKFHNNHTAVQIFTKNGPIAFLPLSDIHTSIVFSVKLLKSKISDEEIINLIRKYNFKYLIDKFEIINKAQLKFSSLRNYYYKNILAFGDLLHRIHPLAGQGFNMTIRDIKILSQIIDEKIDIGLPIDSSIASEFEKKAKHKNFIFSNSIDFIYEFFNFETKIKNDKITKILKYFDNNKFLKKSLIKFANLGL